MAGFKTHISVACGVGAGYAAIGVHMGLPLESCLVGAGLCTIGGILPDLDSKSGIPMRETLALSSAMVPALLLHRFESLGWSNERTVLVMAGIYLAIRFGAGELFSRFTVHRGMWHSLPAAATVGCVVFLAASGVSEEVRYYKAAAAVMGFLTHLFLDEIWSVQVGKGGVHVKKSSGTALKLFGKNTLPNLTAYSALAIVAFLAWNDLNGAFTPEDVQQLASPLLEWSPDAEVWR